MQNTGTMTANADKIKAQDELILELTQKIAQNEKTIEELEQQLNERIGELNNIFQSQSWRLIRVLQKIRTFFIPLGSRREKTARTILANIRRILAERKINRERNQ